MPNASHVELLRRDDLAGRFGVRIADIVTVTEGSGRRLNNNTSHELRTVRLQRTPRSTDGASS